MKKIVNIAESDLNFIAENILEIVPHFCSQFSLVLRDKVELSRKGISFLEELQPYFVEARRSSSWPGTELINGEATIQTYKVCKETVALIKTVGNLFNFVSPEYPEDVCFYESDGKPWLITIAHENDLYFSVGPKDLEILEERFPKMRFLPE